MNFYDNYVKLCNEKGKSPSKVAGEIGLSKTAVNRWKNGGSPTDATVKRIADYFQVDPMELTGGIPIGTLIRNKGPEPDHETAADMIEGIRIDRLAKLGEIVTILSSTSDEDIDWFLTIAKKISHTK